MANIELPLDLPNVNILSTKTLDDNDFLIVLESNKRKVRCPHCFQDTDILHALEGPIRVRHLDVFGMRCFIEFQPRRFRCPKCNNGQSRTFTERLSWHKPRRKSTIAFERWSMFELVNATVTDAAIKLRCSEKSLYTLLDDEISCEPEWEDIEKIGVLGIDEVALKKGHRNYVTIISAQTDKGLQVLGVLDGRLKDPLVEFLKKIPAHLKSTIEAACVDMWEGFAGAVKEALPGVRITADRFHVAKKLGEAVDNLRKKELARLKKEQSEEEAKELKGAMWDCRDMSKGAKDSPALAKLLELSPELEKARELRAELTEKFDTIATEHGGRVALGRWLAKVEQSGLRCFDGFVGMLGRWWKEIGNYFVAGESSGFVEGLNNKVKVLKRRCYGLGSAKTLSQRLRLDLTGYGRYAFQPTPNM